MPQPRRSPWLLRPVCPAPLHLPCSQGQREQGPATQQEQAWTGQRRCRPHLQEPHTFGRTFQNPKCRARAKPRCRTKPGAREGDGQRDGWNEEEQRVSCARMAPQGKQCFLPEYGELELREAWLLSGLQEPGWGGGEGAAADNRTQSKTAQWGKEGAKPTCSSRGRSPRESGGFMGVVMTSPGDTC